MDYQTLLHHLCLDRGWKEPQYDTTLSQSWYLSSVIAFDHFFRGERSKVKEEAKNTAARRAYDYLSTLDTGGS
ncbi:hypothetical protein HI914_06718 [Erysiphe necator]|nr:hypothetical protein HI914_06718 [Erysiphe necator]